MAAAAIEEAISIAQEAVVADERCDFLEAISLYNKSVALIKRGLAVQKEDESVDNTVLPNRTRACLHAVRPTVALLVCTGTAQVLQAVLRTGRGAREPQPKQRREERPGRQRRDRRPRRQRAALRVR